jgi:NAD(P)-dependent dehydrogenase (short-subunit alcohol dehydrogenase family)
MKVVVTGGAGALGGGVGAVFSRAGWSVVATCRSAEEGRGLASGAPVVVDLCDRPAVDAAAAAVGPIEALVCCAGGFSMQPLLSSTPTQYEHLMDLNVRTVVNALAAFGAHLRPGAGAVLVGARTWAGAEGVALYAASKAAVVSLGRSAAREWKGRGVRVNVVLPDLIDTPANRRAMPDADPSGWAAPEEIGEVVRWLCSPEARLVTGQAIDVAR